MYRKLEIWKESIELIKEIYCYADILPKSEDFNLKSQLKRAIVSVTLNISEGKCKSTAKDFAHFLNIASFLYTFLLNRSNSFVVPSDSLIYFSSFDVNNSTSGSFKGLS